MRSSVRTPHRLLGEFQIEDLAVEEVEVEEVLRRILEEQTSEKD